MQDSKLSTGSAITTGEPEYDNESIRFMEAVWGAGHLSPGGNEEVRRIVEGLDFEGKDILDLGCGLGGNAIFLARTYSLNRITGFDIEQPVIDVANCLVKEAELSDRVSFMLGSPGPLPFKNDSFDVVFSKDSMIHIEDKDAIFSEIFRVLSPGGHFAASDWLISHDEQPSTQMQEYIAAEGLGFNMASPKRYKRAMALAGFQNIRTVNRNSWYRVKAHEELRQMTGPKYEDICAIVGTTLVEKNIKTWTLMQTVLDSGEHCPTHLFGVKPAN